MHDPDSQPEQIFHQARQLADLRERDAYLLGACGKDLGLRSKVEALLAANVAAGAFLSSRSLPDPEPVSGAGPEGVGDMIGRYKLLQKIGEGGFGIVYLAEQVVPMRRRVALKVIKLGMDTKQVLARFDLERQALAMMDHPNIAKVLDGGATESGRPFFVMELVQGIPITTYCDRNGLTIPVRLELFGQVCAAVQHAHYKGIVHRDIKPSNVMVTLHDGVPVTKVIDFGIAKATSAELTEKTLFTEFGQVIGTPVYMSPEQAEMSGLDIDTRSDIYSMGVLLYELLTGTTPFTLPELREAGFAEMQRFICEREPLRPSARVSTLKKVGAVASARGTEPKRLGQLMRGDLDWIIMKALEKDRVRRYATANALAADLDRFLGDEPVLASPPSAWRRARKFVRRNRKGVTAVSVGLGLVLAGSVGTTWGLIHERAAKEDARQQRSEAVRQASVAEQRSKELESLNIEVNRMSKLVAEESVRAVRRSYTSYLRAALVSFQAGDYREARTLHALCPEPLRNWEWSHLGLRLDQADAVFGGHEEAARVAEWSPDGSRFASGSDDETVRILDSNDGHLLHVLSGFRSPLNVVRWSPDGGRLLTATRGGSLQIWDAQGGEVLHTLHELGPNMFCAAWSPDGTRVVSGSGAKRLRIWDASTGECLQDTHWPDGKTPTFLAWSPDGAHLASAAAGLVKVWEFVGGEVPEWRAGFYGHSVATFAWSPDGERLLVGGDEGELCAWDPFQDRFEWIRREAVGAVRALALSTDGRRLAVGSSDSSLTIWDAWDLEGAWVESSGWDDLGTWYEEPDSGSERPVALHEFLGHDGEVTSVSWSPNDSRVLTGGEDGTLRIWEARALTNRHDFGAWAPFEAWNADNSELVSGIGYYSTPVVQDSVSGEPVSGWEDRYLSGSCWVWSADGERILAVSDGGEAEVLDAQTGERLRVAPWGGAQVTLEYVSWSPDEARVVYRTKMRSPQVLDFESGERRQVDLGDGAQLEAVAWSPDWSRIVSSTSSGALQLWDAQTEQLLGNLDGHRVPVGCIAWSPDGQRVATGSGDGELRIWDPASRTCLQVLIGHPAGPSAIAWSPDGQRLISGDGDGNVRIWDAYLGDYLLSVGEAVEDLGETRSISWSPDGARIYIASEYESVVLESSRETAKAVWRANELRRAADLEEHAIEQRVESLFVRHVFLEPVLEAIRIDPGLDEEQRRTALEHAEWTGGPSAAELNELAWELVNPLREAPTTDLARGLVYARAAIELEPENHVILDTLAWALFKNGHTEEAIEASTQALEAAPEEDKADFSGYLEWLGREIAAREAQEASSATDG